MIGSPPRPTRRERTRTGGPGIAASTIAVGTASGATSRSSTTATTRSKAGFAQDKLTAALLALEGYEGWTGPIAFEEGTGNRVPALVVVDSVNAEGILGIDQSWAAAEGASAG